MGGIGVGVIIEGPNGITLEQVVQFNFETSNNQTEYKDLIARLRLAWDLGVKQLKCQTDSQLITR